MSAFFSFCCHHDPNCSSFVIIILIFSVVMTTILRIIVTSTIGTIVIIIIIIIRIIISIIIITMIHVYHYSYDHYAACFYCIVSIIIILLRLSVVYIAMIIIAMIAVLLQSLSWSSSLVLFAIWSLFLWLSCSSLFLAVLGHHHSIQRHDANLNPLHFEKITPSVISKISGAQTNAPQLHPLAPRAGDWVGANLGPMEWIQVTSKSPSKCVQKKWKGKLPIQLLLEILMIRNIALKKPNH